MCEAIEYTRAFSPYFSQHFDNDIELSNWCHKVIKENGCEFNSAIYECFKPLLNLSDEDAFKKELRILRHRISCQLIFADINHFIDTPTVLENSSKLARYVINTALNWGYNKLSERFGTPCYSTTLEPMQLAVFGLGKLGGGELNFSSDVDLVFTYEEEGNTNGSSRQLSNGEFFTRLAQRLINLAGELNEYGQPYRIDMRLRPNGNSGPLVLSFAAMEHYFLTHGREWERYAWVKASPIAGDIKSGTELLHNIRPFIYRKYLDYTAIDELSQMKALIEAEAESKGVINSIKLGKGGIRSIEFITQSYQLTRGGRLPSLQTPSLYLALQRIREAQLISNETYEDLVSAYTFYRHLENHIQMVEDKQQHTLPQSLEEQQLHASYMGFADAEQLNKALSDYRERVDQIFEDTFERSASKDTIDSRILLITNHLSQPENRINALSELGFSDPEKHLIEIDELVNGKLSQTLSAKGFSSLVSALNTLISTLVTTDYKARDSILDRLLMLLKSIGRRPTYFSLIADNEGVRSQLIGIAATSEQLVNELGEYPILLDELISSESDFAHFDRAEWQRQLHANLIAAEGDLETQMDILRQQQGAQIFRIAVAEQRQDINRALAADFLVEIAEVIVNESLYISVNEVGLSDDCTIIPIAYGKLGSKELSYNSDLDLVFVYENRGASIDSLYFQRVIRKFTTILTTRTTGGILYTIDDRLRPNGRAGQLVTSIDGYARYLEEQAWTWELQALVRARAIGQDADLNTRIESIRRTTLCQERDINQLKTDISAMNRRMKEHNDSSDGDRLDIKLVTGGLVDIEFIAQFMVLAHAHTYPQELTEPRSTTYILRNCQRLGLLNDEQANTLLEALEKILATSQYKKLAGESTKIQADQWQDTLESVHRVWNQIIEQ